MARGSVFRKDGAWAFRVDAGFNAASGTRRQVLRQGFATKRAAEAALAEMVGDASRGMAVSTSTMKVGAVPRRVVRHREAVAAPDDRARIPAGDRPAASSNSARTDCRR